MRTIVGLAMICWLSVCGILQAESGSWLFLSLLEARKIVTFERNAASGELTRRSEIACPAEPAILSVSPDRKTLFASFRSSGQLASFHIDPVTGQLQLISVVEGGADPAYLLADHSGRFLLAAYYVASKVTVHAIGQDGSLGQAPLQSTPTAEKAHGIALDSANRLAIVPHTGADQIFLFHFDPQTGRLSAANPPFVRTPDGEHPRHIALHPSDRWAYVNNEAGDSLSLYALDSDAATLTRMQTVSTLPDNFDGAQNSTARCEMTPDGRFVYVANRGHDSIAGFAIDPRTGQLTARGQTPTEKTPRSFTIAPGGQFLYAAGEDSGRIAAYRIASDGHLCPVRTYPVGPVPWCVLAVDTPQ